MKTIYKILVAFLAISLIGTASANVIEWSSFNVDETCQFTPNHPTHNGGGIYHSYQKGTLTIPLPTDSTGLKAWHYEDIEII